MVSERKPMDGMTAAAYAAYALSEAAVIFPITPASRMAETVEAWSAAGKKNLLGQPVMVKEMQSEKGVAGMVHGSLAGGALTSTFTASQGLMLMIPNLYKIAGELLPGVFHITSRSLSAHALSIFGDHQDIMAIRPSGICMLASNSVQECMDLSLVAHLSAIQGSLPFAHFFDGFRTSDEITTIDTISPEAMRGLVDWGAVQRFKAQAMDCQNPMMRGTDQNPDIYFQNREAANRYYNAMPAIVQANMDKVAQLAGRAYHLFDYVGAPDATRVVAAMGSACDTLAEAAAHLNAQGQKVGVLKVRLYRPFDATAAMAALPNTVQVLAALDRTKEPGSQGEPLLQDLAQAAFDSGRKMDVIGGRYGLSSKEFSPADAIAVFDHLRLFSGEAAGAESGADKALRRFTVGITDDVTRLSIPVGPAVNTLPNNRYQQSIFYGFGSDGTVGANKQAAKMVGDATGSYVQEYSWFDGKKSGGLTISYQRFSNAPIHSPYLVEEADYIGCHKDIYPLRGYPMLDHLKDGGIFVLNCPWGSLEALGAHLPAAFKQALAAKHARFFQIDANKLAQEVGLGPRINMIMETAFFKLAGVMDFEQAVELLKRDIATLYAAKGQKVIDANIAAIDQTAARLKEVRYPASWAHAKTGAVASNAQAIAEGPAYIRDYFAPISRLEGNQLPVSAMHPAGFQPLGSTAYEKRRVAVNIPEWDVDKCIQCYQCATVCPHAAIRPFVAAPAELEGAPDAFATKPATLAALKGKQLRIQVFPEDCVGCGSCADNCPAPGKALVMKPLSSQLDAQRENLAFAQKNISPKDHLAAPTTVATLQLQQPLLQFSGCCGGCGETPHVKMLTQLFGDRLIIANATGCSSIWGAYSPSMPYCANKRGHGPAWGNSLFEDNAEYGFGITRALDVRRSGLTNLLQQQLADGSSQMDEETRSLIEDWLEFKDEPNAAGNLGRIICENLEAYRPATSEEASRIQRILAEKTLFQKKSVWIVGGDGWAYDIDFDGLDEVLASKQNVNILVLDTEGYSNTGGEMSKATQLGSVSGFSLDGKPTPKKKLGRMMLQYDYVYVANICLGANMQQTIDAFREAESYNGPSIVVALCPCISWGIHGGMATNIRLAKEGVKAGFWPLFRFDPRRAAAGKDPLQVDYAQPTGNMEEFLNKQNRFTALAGRLPQHSALLQSELAKEGTDDYRTLTNLAGVYQRAECDSRSNSLGRDSISA